MISVRTRLTNIKKQWQCPFSNSNTVNKFLSIRGAGKFDSVLVLFFVFFAKDYTFLAFGKAVISIIISNFQLQSTDKCVYTVCGRPTAKKESFSFSGNCGAASMRKWDTKTRCQTSWWGSNFHCKMTKAGKLQTSASSSFYGENFTLINLFLYQICEFHSNGKDFQKYNPQRTVGPSKQQSSHLRTKSLIRTQAEETGVRKCLRLYAARINKFHANMVRTGKNFSSSEYVHAQTITKTTVPLESFEDCRAVLLLARCSETQYHCYSQTMH